MKFWHSSRNTSPHSPPKPNKAFASLSRKAAGSQGSALSRRPQTAKSPFETRGSARVSTKNNFQRRPQAARLPCGQRPLMKTNLRIGFQFCGCAAPRSPFMAWPSKSATALWENAPPGHFLVPQGPLEVERKVPLKRNRKPKDGEPMVFLSIAKRYATGISFTVRSKIAYRRSPRARTPAAYFKARSRPFVTPFFFLSDIHFSRRQGGNVRTPHSGCVLSGAPVCAGTAL